MGWRKTTIWSCLFICTIIILASCSTENESPPQSNIDWEYIEKGIVLEDEISTVNISSDVFSIAIEPSPDEHTYVSFHTNAMKEVKEHFAIRYTQEGDQLSIAVKATKSMTGTDVLDIIKGWDTAFQLQLPERRYDTIALSSNIGNIALEHTQVDELTVTNDVGEIALVHTDSVDAQLKNSVGAVKLQHVKGPIHVKNSTGIVNVEVEHIADDLDIETALGEVSITLSNHPESIALDLVTEIGSVESNLDLSFTRNTRRSVIGQIGSDGPTVKVRTAIGKISVQHQ